jgi:hypothetical protein
MNDNCTSGIYRCHSVSNDVATVLLRDPVLNRYLADMEGTA